MRPAPIQRGHRRGPWTLHIESVRRRLASLSYARWQVAQASASTRTALSRWVFRRDHPTHGPAAQVFSRPPPRTVSNRRRPRRSFPLAESPPLAPAGTAELAARWQAGRLPYLPTSPGRRPRMRAVPRMRRCDRCARAQVFGRSAIVNLSFPPGPTSRLEAASD